MPKLKTKKAAAKRFKITGTGKRKETNPTHSTFLVKSQKEKKKSETCYNRRQNSRKQG